MSCAEWRAEIIERGRVAHGPGEALSSHMRGCDACAAAWREQISLREAIQAAREVGRDHRASEFRRGQLMRQFDQVHGKRNRWRLIPIAAAAAILLAALSVSHPRFTGTGPSGSEVASAVQEDMSDEFVPVPYTAPLAQGERTEVVRTELSSAALGRMGISAPVLEDPVPADVLLGQDGVPRAVRFLDSSEFNF